MDKIIIKDLEVYGNHGVYEEENKLGQKFLISFELHLDLRKAGKTDELEASVHYGELCHKITELFKKENHKLLEKCCENMAEFILREYDMVKGVKVLLKKPWAPIGLPVEYPAVEIFREKHKAYIGVGANMGDKVQNINDAAEIIQASNHTQIVQIARIIETVPFGGVDQDTFMNTVFEIETLLTPIELLNFMLDVEKQLKRERIIRWGPRTLDLDVLFYDDIISEDERVIIPHPGIPERMFVLEPMCELAPYKVHPLLRKRMIDLKNELEG
ncbi:2-amino-4-hydroxy-6-hydroxymethyldihydropteridine diphosphokinase [Oceanirhabdus sp. W0125-5]|uniref:2-amino-4-hydroxy-6- hydroxymethyldihydropteridine diphosphokinase n=1 Tax=Oceanirhabdus sp. W0125-5 TaxID=2999116 RepID=UPI0022F31390|nr:2-amino-4-hydroxy-6-hydroxymethyldihydropteridine diphosphokinase [Oceanirhabdus sp. W0125-5]WBW95996.1 2-amino-4-hydroxy-6-hydroxymethyldihydropteridine diphosphokinase [Oceanirhabdus sp. W0125-5]